ncbi:rab GTPase [Pelomyxa schiedti]|nr:rab GTPase [Pelomyxa schiedti]
MGGAIGSGGETASTETTATHAPTPPLLQVAMLGDPRCGKSALAERLSGDTFSSTYNATLGVNFVRHTFGDDNNPVHIQIWDGGETRMCLPASYFRSKSGALLVYDIRNQCSFDNIRKWHARLKENSPEASVVLVGNMCDEEAHRQIPTSTGRQLASEMHVPFIECSALTGDNVQAAFVQLTTAITSGEQVETSAK